MNNVFLAGEKIDLCVPIEQDFEKWASWFNCQKITQFLEQGKYPNTIAAQKNFYDKETVAGRFLAMVKSKKQDLLGVISLSEIDYEKSSAQVAYVCPEKSESAPLAALEALAICTQHAFERFGLSRVWAGHAYPGLDNWVRKTEIIGYKTNGFMPTGFRHGRLVTDAVRSSIVHERYSVLIAHRDGSLWPGETKTQKILAELKTRASLAQQVTESIKSLHKTHDEWLAEIELNASQ